MARKLAHRYVGRGEQYDDLAQVAALALVKAVDGYDPSREVPFVAYAVPCIIGALKRHFRDSGWAMRVSRSTQELVLQVRSASADLGQQFGRPPTPDELARRLDVPVVDIVAARLAAQSYRSDSLDVPSVDSDQSPGPDARFALGFTDRGYGNVDNRLALEGLLAALPPRERRILDLRFHDEMTQTLIAGEIGVSQMQVSRLLKQSLSRLRLALQPPEQDNALLVPVLV